MNYLNKLILFFFSCLSPYSLKLLFIPVLFTLTLASCSEQYVSGISRQESPVEAVVTAINSDITIEDKALNVISKKTSLKVKILTGPDKGKEINIIQSSDALQENIITPAVNQRVLIGESIMPGGETDLQVQDYRRYYLTWGCLIIALGVIIAAAGRKGLLFAFFSVVMLTIFYLVIFPLVSYGVTPLIPVLLLCLFVSLCFNFYYHKATYKFYLLVAANIITFLTVSFISLALFAIARLENLLSDISLYPVSTVPAASFTVSVTLLLSLNGILNTSSSTINNYLFIKKKLPKIKVKSLLFRTFTDSRNIFLAGFLQVFLILSALLFPFMVLRTRFYSLNMLLNSELVTFSIIAYLIAVLAILISSVTTILLIGSRRQGS